MRGQEELSPLPYPSSPPDCLPAFPLNNRPMATFEIAVRPSVAKNLQLCRTSGTNKRPVEDPVTTLCLGSITHDRKQGKMPSKWKNEEDFHAWLAAEESNKGIELVVSHVRHSDSPIWWEQHVLKCLHEWTGSRPAQNKSESPTPVEQDRKIPSKKTGCQCRLTLKFYRHTETILGRYESKHDHPLGDDNLRFTRLTDRTRELVMEMVHTGVKTKIIVRDDLLDAYLRANGDLFLAKARAPGQLKPRIAITISRRVILIAFDGSFRMRRSVSMRTTRF